MNKMSMQRARIGAARACAVLSMALACAGQLQAQNVDMGDASVMSQQGQRLKVAVPYGIDGGHKASVLSFEVASVEAGEGFTAPAARQFTVSKPERGHVIYLHSAEVVNAPTLKLVLAVAGNPEKRFQYDLAVPPASASRASQADPGRSTVRHGRPVKKAKAHRRVRHLPRHK